MITFIPMKIIDRKIIKKGNKRYYQAAFIDKKGNFRREREIKKFMHKGKYPRYMVNRSILTHEQMEILAAQN